MRVGTYAPTITIPALGALGSWTVHWRAKRETADPWVESVTTVPVLAVGEPIPDGYALVSQLRAEGVPVAFSDAQISEAIERQSRFVEQVCRRFFEPRYLVTQHDGSGRGIQLQFNIPVIGVEDLEVTYSDFRPIARFLGRENVRVYNRHMRGLMEPDDRESPKLAILRIEDALANTPRFPALSRRFTPAQLNIQVAGYWGYTDPDGSPLGRTPAQLSRVVMMLAMRDIRPLWSDFKAGRRGTQGGVVTGERTRDQSVQFGYQNAGALSAGWITGDPEIDRILSMYIGPMPMAAV